MKKACYSLGTYEVITKIISNKLQKEILDIPTATSKTISTLPIMEGKS